MGLQPQFARARAWVAANLTFHAPRLLEDWDGLTEVHVSVFETTIRAVGGLLAAGQLAGDALLVRKAAEIAERLLPAFDTATGVPLGWVQLVQGGVRDGASATLSEFATLSLEFISLSELTGDPRFGAVAEGALAHALRAPGRYAGDARGLWRTLLEPHGGSGFFGGRVSFGGAGDSAYEYLLKTWLLAGKRPGFLPYRHLFDAAADSLAARLTRRTAHDRLLYIAEQVSEGSVADQMEHLACFMAGTFVMAAEGARAERYMAYAEELGETCWQMYARQGSGLAPDAVRFVVGGAGTEMQGSDMHWQLRPETIESLFYLWRATGDEVYRRRGWAVFLAVERRCRLPSGGYAGLRDTGAPGAEPGAQSSALDGTQPSWFLAETLKYFFLMFADSEALDLNAWVLNTEAHPLRVPPALRASLLQGVPAEALVPSAPLPRGLSRNASGAAGGFAHDAAGPEEPWVTQAWARALEVRAFNRSAPAA
jgi:mannosyl-oligosaccharide alpha-1,2-mannosidase